MQKSRFSRISVSLSLLVILLWSLLIVPAAAEATPTPTPTPIIPELKLTSEVPSYVETSVTSFFFTVNMTYSGEDTIMVNLSTTAPQGWSSKVTFQGKEITSLPIGPLAWGSPDSKSLSLTLQPNAGFSPEPGEYKTTLKATSGKFSQTIELTGIIRTKLGFFMSTETGNLATRAVAGRDNNLAIEMVNTGSGPLENITLTSSKPEAWVIRFEPDKISSLGAGQTAQANVVIVPPSDKTIAGDYNITLMASNPDISSSLVIRVTVETPAIWGTVAIVLIVVVIAGLAVLFLKLGRR